MSRRTFSFDGGGPPDPIEYLRRISRLTVDETDSDSMSRVDSTDDVVIDAIDEGGEKVTVFEEPPKKAHHEHKKKQDPPARERPPEGQDWPYRDTLSFTRSLIFYGAGAVTHEHEQACKSINEARGFRKKYCGQSGLKTDKNDLKTGNNLTWQFGKEGVVELFHESDVEKEHNLCQVPNIDDFHRDYSRLVQIVNDGAMRSYCFQRLQILSTAFRMHTTMNAAVEMQEQSNLLGTDFYRTFKIDNHIHAAAAPTAKQFVDFVRTKLENEGDTVVQSDGKTLSEVFYGAGLDKDHLTIDAFAVLADYSVYQRFDNFNAKYSPFRMADMRRIFLKTTNHIGGRFFAELLKIVLNRHETGKGHNSACEMRLSIYGMERHEWKDLADWMLHDWPGGDFPGNVRIQKVLTNPSFHQISLSSHLLLLLSHNRWFRRTIVG
jgi:hypothetical protein